MEEIARELKVDAIVEGVVERYGERVRITVHLAQGKPERQLWAEQYDRDIRDVLSVQDDIARTVANEIREKLSLGETRNIRNRGPVNPESHNAPLRLESRFLAVLRRIHPLRAFG